MGAMSEDVTTGKPAAAQFENVPCPFCGILCDDLTIAAESGGLKVVQNGCPKAVAGFERKVKETGPRVAGKPASLDEAIAAAAGLIKAANLPLFGGLATDVDGMRAVMAIADQACGVVDHVLSEAQYRNFKVLQTGGWVTTTLTEARNRADLFIILGSNVHTMHPRFFERIVCNERSMFSDNPPKRTVVFIGDDLDQSGAVGSRIGEVITLPVKRDRIAEVLAAMRAMHKGVHVATDTIAGIPAKDVEDLVERCKKASYGVMVWVPPCLKFPNADLTVQAAAEYIKEINLTSRFAGLSLGGNEGSVSAAAVCAWQSGFPLRVSFASGKPEYDAERFALNRLLAEKEVDLLFWVASFMEDLTPPDSDVPTIALATPGMTFKKEPAVFIPVGTPGLDHRGLLVRCDNVVSLPLRDLGRAALPNVAGIVAKIQAAL